MLRSLFIVGFVLAAFAGLPTTADAGSRVALLVANASYVHTTALNNPPNDVELLGRTLRQAGFDKVIVLKNLGRDAMVKALRDFEDKVAEADIALIYFSGHGIEIGGENYLVPVDAGLLSDRDIADETVSLDRVLASVEGAKRLRLVILDACRNNPFLPAMLRTKLTRSVNRGLARVEPPTADTLVAFAAKAGTTAIDGEGSNSPFASALAVRLPEPGVDVQFALRKVRDDVLAATGRQQEPFSYGSLGGEAIAIVPLGQAAGDSAKRPLEAPGSQNPSTYSGPTVAALVTEKAGNASPCTDIGASLAAVGINPVPLSIAEESP
jgi:uncharacterized caspase-like protein